MQVFESRKTPVANYYGDWTNWLPIMKAYAGRQPSYFGTPAVNLVFALETSLKMILKEGMKNRVLRHRKMAKAFRSAMKALGLKMIPTNDKVAANTLSAIYYPGGVNGGELLKGISHAGIIVAGGLLPELKTNYFRVGHMGSVNQSDLLSTIGAIESGLRNCGYKFESGIGLRAAQDVLYDVN
jgi:alanine-glyoxylate transaminase / serine-glyoxylate transaminase / serine-pyruvate transaminase